MKHLSAFLLAIAITLPAVAQDDGMPAKPGFLMFNQNIVAGTDLEKVNQIATEKIGPVLNALVDEGKLTSWGILTHNWGDEWNWNWYVFAENREAFHSAWGEMARRVQEADSETFTQLMGMIEEHKDNFYAVRNFRVAPPTDSGTPPRFLMLNQAIANGVHLARLNEISDTVMGPILDELLAEGLIAGWGDLAHAWGDEWNANWWMSTANHAAFVTAWNELVSRVQERAPETFEESAKLVRRHRDNLYYHAYSYAGGQ